MKKYLLIFMITGLFECKPEKIGSLYFDPSKFSNSEISLSAIADDITYIPLDNTFPIGMIYTIKIYNDIIYLSARDLGVLAFNADGKFLKRFGKIGRGPGEYVYCNSFAVDNKSKSVYVMNRDNVLEIYSGDGNHLGSKDLSQIGGNFRDIEIFNSRLFISEYIAFGKAEFNWIVADTLGNILSKKENSVQPFVTRYGANGGIFKFDDKLHYWNSYNDTVFSVSSDLTCQPSFLITSGDHRLPKSEISYSSIPDFYKQLTNYFRPTLVLETNHYIIIQYSYKEKGLMAFIDKINKITYTNYYTNEVGGLINDIDNGPIFEPKSYYSKKGYEFLSGYVTPFYLKKHVTGIDPKIFSTQNPERLQELMRLAESLKETDNPIIILARLK